MKKSNNNKELEDALKVLENASLRQTQPRKEILKKLISDHGPFSVDEMLSFKTLQRFDRVTLYRCLSVFEELMLVQRCEFGDGVSRYEYARDSHHHHVICKRCKKFEIINQCISKKMIKEVSMMGYKNISHNLEFFGTCQACAY